MQSQSDSFEYGYTYTNNRKFTLKEQSKYQ